MACDRLEVSFDSVMYEVLLRFPFANRCLSCRAEEACTPDHSRMQDLVEQSMRHPSCHERCVLAYACRVLSDIVRGSYKTALVLYTPIQTKPMMTW